MIAYQENQKYFNRTVKVLQPQVLFVFSKEIWDKGSDFWGSNGKELTNQLYQMYYKSAAGMETCLCVLIPHFSHPVTYGFGGGNVSEVLERIKPDFEQSYQEFFPS